MSRRPAIRKLWGMRIAPRFAIGTLCLAFGLPAQGVGLRELPALARERSARQRPGQLAAMQPFLAVLSLDYKRNAEVLDETIAQVAALGDGTVPILLEYLSPDSIDQASHHLAANSARVLTLLEPAGFLDPLLELLEQGRTGPRQLALSLLGHTEHRRAATAIAELFPKLGDSERAEALDAMRRLQSDLLAGPATELLAAEESRMRHAALRYLTAVGTVTARDQVIAALRAEAVDRLLPDYIAFFARLVREDATATDALLPLVRGVRLDPEDLVELVTALGDIAPKGHAAARAILSDIIKLDTSRLGIAAALSLQRLGDESGKKDLFEELRRKINRRRSYGDYYADRADAHAAFEQWRDAAKDYEQAIKHSRTPTRRALFYLQIARCEAHRDNAQRFVKALRKSGYGRGTIEREAGKDPVFEAALERDSVQRFLRGLDENRGQKRP